MYIKFFIIHLFIILIIYSDNYLYKLIIIVNKFIYAKVDLIFSVL